MEASPIFPVRGASTRARARSRVAAPFAAFVLVTGSAAVSLRGRRGERAAAAPSSNLRAPPAASALAALNEVYKCSDDECYSCENGNPGVATKYSNGDFGTLDGDWYAVAVNFEASALDCMRMIFEVDAEELHQEMLYEGTANGDSLWFNVTQYKYDDVVGMWTGGGPKSWATVPAVGNYSGSRWFMYYRCGDDVSFTERGEVYVLKDTLDYDDDFMDMIERKMEDLGLLDDSQSEFFETIQSSDCDYTWPTSGL